MSADNGVYILKTLKHANSPVFEYRVNLIHAVGNLFIGPEFLYGAFEHSGVYETIEEAEAGAIEIEDEADTEEGILLIEDFANLTWQQLAIAANALKLEEVA